MSRLGKHLAYGSGYAEDFKHDPELEIEEIAAHLSGGTKQWSYMGLDVNDENDILAALDAATHVIKTMHETHQNLPATQVDEIFSNIVDSARPGISRRTLKGAIENVRTGQSAQHTIGNEQSNEGRKKPEEMMETFLEANQIPEEMREKVRAKFRARQS